MMTIRNAWVRSKARKRFYDKLQHDVIMDSSDSATVYDDEGNTMVPEHVKFYSITDYFTAQMRIEAKQSLAERMSAVAIMLHFLRLLTTTGTRAAIRQYVR